MVITPCQRCGSRSVLIDQLGPWCLNCGDRQEKKNGAEDNNGSEEIKEAVQIEAPKTLKKIAPEVPVKNKRGRKKVIAVHEDEIAKDYEELGFYPTIRKWNISTGSLYALPAVKKVKRKKIRKAKKLRLRKMLSEFSKRELQPILREFLK